MTCTHADAVIRFVRPAGKVTLSYDMLGIRIHRVDTLPCKTVSR